MFDARRRTPRCAWGVWLFDEAPRRERGAVGREQRGRLMLATIGCCGVSCRHRPRELFARSSSRRDIAYVATSCVRLLSRSLSQRPCLGARLGVDSARVVGSLLGTTAGGWLFGGSVSAYSGLPRRVFDCLMPGPSDRRGLRRRGISKTFRRQVKRVLKLCKTAV